MTTWFRTQASKAGAWNRAHMVVRDEVMPAFPHMPPSLIAVCGTYITWAQKAQRFTQHATPADACLRCVPEAGR